MQLESRKRQYVRVTFALDKTVVLVPHDPSVSDDQHVEIALDNAEREGIDTENGDYNVDMVTLIVTPDP